jgi:hypothetical protein
MHAIVECAELLHADPAARVHAPRSYPDLGAEAELAAVGGLGGSVVQQDRGIDFSQETIGGRGVFGDVGLDMGDRCDQPVDDADRHDRIQMFGGPA